ncbi:unnamed protein product [Arctogadus glacialis]
MTGKDRAAGQSPRSSLPPRPASAPVCLSLKTGRGGERGGEDTGAGRERDKDKDGGYLKAMISIDLRPDLITGDRVTVRALPRGGSQETQTDHPQHNTGRGLLISCGGEIAASQPPSCQIETFLRAAFPPLVATAPSNGNIGQPESGAADRRRPEVGGSMSYGRPGDQFLFPKGSPRTLPGGAPDSRPGPRASDTGHKTLSSARRRGLRCAKRRVSSGGGLGLTQSQDGGPNRDWASVRVTTGVHPGTDVITVGLMSSLWD